ncbi:chain length regulator [Listeria floridensis FSL S10-1187]|uniref:Chain length regulator n=1 Tax=Listeria floridensis FSL S10-1187 TaxID=1265817 RepID=A0ABN0RIY1_9LIST|nr:Wzz/FepE/Etk N-terminal domain-containing protein [Listeria floridensis]EUJ33811.1 chain length regulator [Listeria floridensis FSL S10-1187]
MEELIDLKRIFGAINRGKWYILGAIGLCVCIMSIYLWFGATPIYQSKTQVLVNQVDSKDSSIQAQDVQANLQLVDTYSAIVTSPRILKEVEKELSNKYSQTELANAIQVSNNSNSQIIEIAAEYTNAKDATAIANKTAQVFERQIPNIMKVDNVTILSEAQYSKTQAPVKPHKSLMLGLSFVVGALIGAMIIFVQTIFDRTIKNVDDLQEALGLTVLGTVNAFEPDQMETEKSFERRKIINEEKNRSEAISRIQ